MNLANKKRKQLRAVGTILEIMPRGDEILHTEVSIALIVNSYISQGCQIGMA